jgi:HD domain
MEAVAGRSDEGSQDEGTGRSGCAVGEPDVLMRVAALACRVAAVDEAVVLLRGRGGTRSLVAVARHGRSGAPVVAWRAEHDAVRRALASGRPAVESDGTRRLIAAAPLIVDGETRGVLAVSTSVADRRLGRERLETLAELAELAELASASLAERDLRGRAEAMLSAGADVLARAVDKRDRYTGRHSAQVAVLARRVGARIGIAAERLGQLECAARLHDVGKLGVPDAILQKPGPLDEDEWAVMRCHPEWGAEMVSTVPGLEDLPRLVAAHHERWDGRGYPHGLAAEGIPLASRVISACDAFKAMISRRPYRAPLSVEAALAELVAGAGSQFDPAVVEAVEVEAASLEPPAGIGLA